MPVTDLQRVAQWAKSSGAPPDVYNAACRMLDQPDELVAANDTIERVKAFAVELRTYCSPAGIASVYADTLETVLSGAESHRDGRTPQTLGTSEGQATTETHGAAQ
jgi:hypothetical protein